MMTNKSRRRRKANEKARHEMMGSVFRALMVLGVMVFALATLNTLAAKSPQFRDGFNAFFGARVL
jgi:hypothetical protein